MSGYEPLENFTPKRITFGVSVERHSKGVNFGIRVDGAETEDELMERVKKLWDALEYRFGKHTEG